MSSNPFFQALLQTLIRFKSQQIKSLEDVYDYWPVKGDANKAKIGSGSYGDAFKVRAVDAQSTREPVRVCKTILMKRVSKNPTQTQHLAAELAVSGMLNHPHLNHRVALFHTLGDGSDQNPPTIFIILELVSGPRPTVECRVAHLLAYRRPSRLVEVDEILERWKMLMREKDNVDPDNEEQFGDFVDKNQLVRQLAAEVGVNLTRDEPELPTGVDLFGLIVAYRRISDPMAAIIMRQLLLGVEELHNSGIVHRDLKTENIVVQINRTCQIRREGGGGGGETGGGGKITGVSFREKIHSKVIDFGLVKFLNLRTGESAEVQSEAVISPSEFKKAQQVTPQSKQSGKQEDEGETKKKVGQDDGDQDEEEEEEEEEEEQPQKDPFANASQNLKPVQAPAEAGSVNAFSRMAVSACGTEMYLAIEALQGIISAGAGGTKWQSSKETLPGLDSFGAACCLFCMSNGKPPFRTQDNSYRRVSRETRLREIEALVAKGPQFISTVSPDSRSLTCGLMDNDLKKRFTITQALQHPFVNHNCSTVITDIAVNGPGSIQMISDSVASSPAQTNSGTSNANTETSATPQAKSHTSSRQPTMDGANNSNVGTTGGGGGGGNQPGMTPHPSELLLENESATNATAAAGGGGGGGNQQQQKKSEKEQQYEQQQQQQQQKEDSSSPERDHQEEEDQQVDDINLVMQVARGKEDEGDAEGKPDKKHSNNNLQQDEDSRGGGGQKESSEKEIVPVPVESN